VIFFHLIYLYFKNQNNSRSVQRIKEFLRPILQNCRVTISFFFPFFELLYLNGSVFYH